MALLKKILSALKTEFGMDIEGHLINVDTSKVGGLHLKTGSNCVVNVVNVAVDPSALHELVKREDFDLSKIIRENDKKDEYLTVGAVRSDLLDIDSLAIDSQEKIKPILKKLKRVLPEDDLIALSISININRLEIVGESDKALEMKKRYVRKYGERGKRIYNFYNTGMMAEIIIPYVNLLDWVATPSDIDNILKLWNACLEEMDYAIYVNSLMAVDEIVDQLKKRFRIDDIPIIHIFGRTCAIIDKIDEAVESFKIFESDHQIDTKTYEITRKHFSMGSCDVVQVTIVQIND